MELRFELTGRFTKKYGENAEINDFCSKICTIANEGHFSNKLDHLGVIPAIVPESEIAEGYGPEFSKIELKYRIATIAKRINFDSYMAADNEGKKALLAECLFSAIEPQKKKMGFDLDSFKAEVNKLL